MYVCTAVLSSNSLLSETALSKRAALSDGSALSMERAMGIEPTSKAWEVAVQILEDDMPFQGESLKPLLYKGFKDFSF